MMVTIICGQDAEEVAFSQHQRLEN